MAMDPLVWELSVYDLTIAMVHVDGVGEDLRHLERKCKVKAYSLEPVQKPVEHLEECLTGCSLVLVAVGVPSKGRSKSDLLKINGNIAKTIVEACAKFCPKAVVGLIVNPLNSVVPAMARLYEKHGLDPRRICGITTLDGVRANKFVHEESDAPIERIKVPVIGGYSGFMSGQSVVPLFSQDRTAASFSAEVHERLVLRVQEAGEEIMAAKRGKGSATLSMAYAGARFGGAVLAGLSGQRTQEAAYLKSDICPGLDYFASQVTFGPSGVEQVHPIGVLSSFENDLLQKAKEMLQTDIQEGYQYARDTSLAIGGR